MDNSQNYEIRRERVTVAQSPIPRLGYSREALRQMMADGYGYYVDGKRVKKLER